MSKSAEAEEHQTEHPGGHRRVDPQRARSTDAGELFAQALELRASAERELAGAVVSRQEALATAEATVAEARDVAARLQETTAARADEETLQARERAAGILAGARDEAEQHLTDARAEATRVLEEATAESVRLREAARAEAAETTERLRVEAEAEVARAFGEVRALVADRARVLEENLGSLQATLARAELSLDHVWVLAGSTVLSAPATTEAPPTVPVDDADAVPAVDGADGADEVDEVDEVDVTAEAEDTEGAGVPGDPEVTEVAGASDDAEGDGSVDTPVPPDPSVFGARPAPEGAKPLSWLFRSS